MLKALGKVVDYIPYPDRGYYKLIVRQQIPFDFIYLNFWIWDPLNTLKEYVQVYYEREGDFNIFNSILPAVLHECQTCFSYLEEGDLCNDETKCSKCIRISSENIRVDNELELFDITQTQYTCYERCIHLHLTNDDVHFRSVIREHDPLYLKAAMLNGGTYHITGWCSGKNIKISNISSVPLSSPAIRHGRSSSLP